VKIALTTICPDARQRALLAVSRPTWEVYAKRHNLPILVVENPPHREHFYWGKYFPLTLPSFAGFDAVLVLDNDILINADSPPITEGWNPEKIAIADEREQFAWVDDFVADYYRDYADLLPEAAKYPRVLSTGVLLYTRAHVPIFEQAHASWTEWRGRATAADREAQSFKYAADQPHISLALQAANQAQVLPPAFNRVWWSWYHQRGRLPWRAFQVYAKASSILESLLPPKFVMPFARPGARVLEEALADCHFLHIAGSKSPMWLFAHRRKV
jgi:hypothetical protein